MEVKHSAATRIQALWRGYHTRKRIKWDQLRAQIAINKEIHRSELTKFLCTPGAVLSYSEFTLSLPALLLQRRRNVGHTPSTLSPQTDLHQHHSQVNLQMKTGISPLGLSHEDISQLLSTTTYARNMSLRCFSAWLLAFLMSPMSIENLPSTKATLVAWNIRSYNLFIQSFWRSVPQSRRPRPWIFSDMGNDDHSALPKKGTQGNSKLTTSMDPRSISLSQSSNLNDGLILVDYSKAVSFVESKLNLAESPSIKGAEDDFEASSNSLPYYLKVWTEAHQTRESTGAFFADVDSLILALKLIANEVFSKIIPAGTTLVRRLSQAPVLSNRSNTSSKVVAVGAHPLSARSLLFLVLRSNAGQQFSQLLINLAMTTSSSSTNMAPMSPGNFVVTSQPGVYSIRAMFPSFESLCDKLITFYEESIVCSVSDFNLNESNGVSSSEQSISADSIILNPCSQRDSTSFSKWRLTTRAALVNVADMAAQRALHSMERFDECDFNEEYMKIASRQLFGLVKGLLSPQLHILLLSECHGGHVNPASESQVSPELTCAILAMSRGSIQRAKAHLSSLLIDASRSADAKKAYTLDELLSLIAKLDFEAEKTKIDFIMELADPETNMPYFSSSEVLIYQISNQNLPDEYDRQRSVKLCIHEVDSLLFEIPRCQECEESMLVDVCPVSEKEDLCFPLCFRKRALQLLKSITSSGYWCPVPTFADLKRFLGVALTAEHDALARAKQNEKSIEKSIPKNMSVPNSWSYSDSQTVDTLPKASILSKYIEMKNVSLHNSSQQMDNFSVNFSHAYHINWETSLLKEATAPFILKTLLSADGFTLLVKATLSAVMREQRVMSALNLRQSIVKYQQHNQSLQEKQAIHIQSHTDDAFKNDPLKGLSSRERKEQLAEIEAALKSRERARGDRRLLMEALQPGAVSFFSNCSSPSLTITARDLDALILTCNGAKQAAKCVQRLEEIGAKFHSVPELLAAVVIEQRKREMLEFLLSCDALEDAKVIGFRAALSKRMSTETLAAISDDALSDSEDEEYGWDLKTTQETRDGRTSKSFLNEENATNTNAGKKSTTNINQHTWLPRTPCMLLCWKPMRPQQLYETRQAIEERKQAMHLPLELSKEEINAASLLASVQRHGVEGVKSDESEDSKHDKSSIDKSSMNPDLAAAAIARVSEVLIVRERAKQQAEDEICLLERNKITLEDIDFICSVASASPVPGYASGSGDVFRAIRRLNRRIAMELAHSRFYGSNGYGKNEEAESNLVSEFDPRIGSVLELALALKNEVMKGLCSRLMGEPWNRVFSRFESESSLTSQFAPLPRSEALIRFEYLYGLNNALGSNGLSKSKGARVNTSRSNGQTLVVFQPHTLEQCPGGRREAHFQLKASIPLLHTLTGYGHTSLCTSVFDSYYTNAQEAVDNQKDKQLIHRATFGPSWVWSREWNVLDWIPLQHTFPSQNDEKLPDIPPLEALLDVVIEASRSFWFGPADVHARTNKTDARPFDTPIFPIVAGYTGLTWTALTSRSALPSAWVQRALKNLGEPSSVERALARKFLFETLSYPLVSNQLFGYLCKPIHLSVTHLDLLLLVSGGITTPEYSLLKVPGAVIAILAAVRSRSSFSSFDSLARYISMYHERCCVFLRCSRLLRSRYAQSTLWSTEFAAQDSVSSSNFEIKDNYLERNHSQSNFSAASVTNSISRSRQSVVDEPSTSRFIVFKGKGGSIGHGSTSIQTEHENSANRFIVPTLQKQPIITTASASTQFTNPSFRRSSSPTLNSVASLTAKRLSTPPQPPLSRLSNGIAATLRSITSNYSSVMGSTPQEGPLPRTASRLLCSSARLALRQHLLRSQEESTSYAKVRACKERRRFAFPQLPESGNPSNLFLTKQDLEKTLEIGSLLSLPDIDNTLNYNPGQVWTDFFIATCSRLSINYETLERLILRLVRRQCYSVYSFHREHTSGSVSSPSLTSEHVSISGKSSSYSMQQSTKCQGTMGSLSSTGTSNTAIALKVSHVNKIQIATRSELIRLLEFELSMEMLRYMSCFALPTIAPAGFHEISKEEKIARLHLSDIVKSLRASLSLMWRRIRTKFVRSCVEWRSCLVTLGVPVDGLRLRMRREDDLDMRLVMNSDEKENTYGKNNDGSEAEDEEGEKDQSFMSFESRLNATYNDGLKHMNGQSPLISPHRYSLNETLAPKSKNSLVSELSSILVAKYVGKETKYTQAENYEMKLRAKALASEISASECARNAEWRALRSEWNRLRKISEHLLWEATPPSYDIEDNFLGAKVLDTLRQKVSNLKSFIQNHFAMIAVNSEKSDHSTFSSPDLEFMNSDSFLVEIQRCASTPAIACRILDKFIAYAEYRSEADRELLRTSKEGLKTPLLLDVLKNQISFLNEVERCKLCIDLQNALYGSHSQILCKPNELWPNPPHDPAILAAFTIRENPNQSGLSAASSRHSGKSAPVAVGLLSHVFRAPEHVRIAAQGAFQYGAKNGGWELEIQSKSIEPSQHNGVISAFEDIGPLPQTIRHIRGLESAGVRCQDVSDLYHLIQLMTTSQSILRGRGALEASPARIIFKRAILAIMISIHWRRLARHRWECVHLDGASSLNKDLERDLYQHPNDVESNIYPELFEAQPSSVGNTLDQESKSTLNEKHYMNIVAPRAFPRHVITASTPDITPDYAFSGQPPKQSNHMLSLTRPSSVSGHLRLNPNSHAGSDGSMNSHNV